MIKLLLKLMVTQVHVLWQRCTQLLSDLNVTCLKAKHWEKQFEKSAGQKDTYIDHF